MFEGLVLTILERVLGQCATPPARCASVFLFLPCVPCMTCDHSFPPLNSRAALACCHLQMLRDSIVLRSRWLFGRAVSR